MSSSVDTKHLWGVGLPLNVQYKIKRSADFRIVFLLVKCSIKVLHLHTHLKFVIWFSRRTRNRSLISSKRSFSSTATVPRPSGLFYKQNMPLFTNWLGRKIHFESRGKWYKSKETLELVYLLLQQLIMILHHCFLKSCILSVKANQTPLTFQYAVYYTCNNKTWAWHTESRKKI